ncbi:MAG: cell wall hydrolase [Alphaproteobacteria bacterium]|nr:cell wall hydrolase [Alphaproteobacteria bacterium]MBU1513452.1 cell wall hydrolase [Alphaproteobacteria bacterium]MBU2096444.1 cell wall hydrolase [Alphaproteobacteria bacterium]MBU2149864.1 cell wall hydrolase [Alphaproteobacteria bacterium]MBU2308230.1 cell wall hydrolase [Alphaproteobacteria bacterium]
MALTALLAGPACAPQPQAHKANFVSRDLSNEDLFKLASSMDPAMRALALRHDPASRAPDLWARPQGWGSLDMAHIPDLGLSTQTDAASAEEINDLRPFAKLPIRPMQPFVLKASGEDRARAVQCLSQAVYYEAAREPEVGQEAVAQVVLNRMRHPAYPKTVCGVVYQGSARVTGCQFTFTCDGALRFTPQAALWSRAKAVAERALNGYVDKTVGSATHYHAQYVSPYWAPTLVKMTQVGQHIFYRWTGPWGEPPAFTGRYAGGEAYLSPAVLGSLDARTQGGGLFAPDAQGVPAERKITLAVAGEVRTYSVVDPNMPSGERTRVMGVLMSTRRAPTPDEVKRINQSLEAMERSMDQKSAPAPSIAPTAAPGGPAAI